MRRVFAAAAVLILAASAHADERVDVTAMDGTQLIGVLGGSSGPGVVLVHGERADRRRWEALAESLATRGFRTLRIDLRGHGESTGGRDLAAADRDVEGAYRYLLGRKIRPVFLVGEGVGGRAALTVASRVPVAGVAVLGAPSVSTGSDPLPAVSAPILVVVAAADREAPLASGLAGARVVVVTDADLVASPQAKSALLELLAGSQPGGATK